MRRSFSADRRDLLSGNTTLPDLVEGCLQRIRSGNDVLNALIEVYGSEAIAEARRIQEAVDKGAAGPLAGCILSLKDVYAHRGMPLTCGSGILQGFRSVYDATVVRKLKEADAIIIGRANMDEFAMGSSNEHSVYGPVRNPLDTDKVPGGSSGGSAASVAAGFANASLGSDTGGSVRQPASYTGIVGLKPTYGRISRYGLVAYASSFDCVGPMGGSVEDVARLLQVLAGQDPHDHSSSPAAVADYLSSLEDERTFRIGVPREYFEEGLDAGIRSGVESLIARLEAKGHSIVPVSLSTLDYAISTYYILATAEASSNLARYDGVRYGRRMQSDEGTLADLYKETRTKGFGAEVKRRIMLGTYVLSKGYYDAYYAKAQKVRRLIREDFARAFGDVDLILSPSTPTTAFGIGQLHDDPLAMYLNDIYTLSANLAGICAVSIPAGVHPEGLPYGVQLQAPAFREDLLLNAAQHIERMTS